MKNIIALAVLVIVSVSVASAADAPTKKPGAVPTAITNFKNGVKAIPGKFRAGVKNVHDRFAKKPAAPANK